MFESPEVEKEKMYEACAVSVVKSNLHILVTKQKGAFRMLANVVVDNGKSLDVTTKVGLYDLMPSLTPICTTLQQLAEQRRADLRKDMSSIMHIGGGITYDGLTHKVKGGKYYGEDLHYFCITKTCEVPRSTQEYSTLLEYSIHSCHLLSGRPGLTASQKYLVCRSNISCHI